MVSATSVQASEIQLIQLLTDTGRVYFLGNRVSKCQQMIANYVMGCELPIADANKGERLPFQDKLEEKMKTFTLAEFKNGTFFAHD